MALLFVSPAVFSVFLRSCRILICWISVFFFIAPDCLRASPEIIGSLIDPVKLDSLRGDRAANGRMRKIAYWLETDRREGLDPAEVIATAQKSLAYKNPERAAVVKASLLRNLTILQRLGCLEEDGMEKLRRGRAPEITKGPYAGDIVHVDHIIPRAIAPGLDEKLYNLEFMPGSMNSSKGAKIGQRQIALAKEWRALNLISPEEYQKVVSAKGA
ncbi:hypothetical protein [Luteolibacter sp. AS25]|uniref:hypothetical protein n=1 Tax=Luteolibacter sp. AS25 TaxID=3135776 RepID=UPI00398BAE8E